MEWLSALSSAVASLGVPSGVAGDFIMKVQTTQEDITQTLTELTVLVNKIYEEVMVNERS